MNKYTGWDDTIIALATAPGVGAIGVIRLSGQKSIQIINGLFPSKDLSKQASHTIHVGLLKDGATQLDEVVVSLFKAPTSYTGEEVVEVSCHGSPYIQQQIIAACVKHGARIAKPGEFTQRAFLNGKLDLTQAEAVADLISSGTAAAQRTALHNVRGGFSTDLSNLREQLVQFAALIELELDFSQEDVEFVDRSKLKLLLKEVEVATTKLSNSFQLGNVIKNGVNTAIIGKPNAGKSTLLNGLLNENRAIVSDIPGTTRDTIEEVLNIDGLLFRLIDTAGLRQHTSDIIESAGIERSLQKMQSADLVLYVFDCSEDPAIVADWKIQAEKEQLNYLLVANKIDEKGEEWAHQRFGKLDELVFISAKEGAHLSVLKQRMIAKVLKGDINTEDTIVTNARHYHSLQEVLKSLIDIHSGIEKELPGDLLALDIRRCLHFLGEITGEITNEDQLDYIFSKFCIGK